MSPLNENHRRHILHSFLAIEEQLARVEALIAQAGTASPLSPHIKDLSPEEGCVVGDHIARIRAALLSHLSDLGIPPEIRRKSVRWSVQTSLLALQITVEDLSPGKLAGYGPLDSAGRETIVRIQDDLRRLSDRVFSYVRQGVG